MKKFYSLALAAAVALSASAFSSNTKELRNPGAFEINKQAFTPETQLTHKAIKSIKKVADIAGAPAKAPAKAASINDLEGLWDFELYDALFQDSPNEFVTVTFAATVYDDLILFEDVDGMEMPMVASFDAATSKVTFETEYLGAWDFYDDASRTSTTRYYIYQEFFDASQGVDVESVSLSYDATNKVLAATGYPAILWSMYTKEVPSSEDDFYGYYYGFIFDSAKLQGLPVDEGWVNIGEADFEDAWLFPGIGIDRADPTYIYKVPLQRSLENENIFRLVDPYHVANNPAKRYNASKVRGFIMLDVTDPDHVVINGSGIDAGFANSSIDMTNFYCFNRLGCLVAEYGSMYSVADIVQIIGDEIPYTTFKDGKITIPADDARFGDQTAPLTGGYVWVDQRQQPVDMSGSITFPAGWNGVNDVMTDNNANAPVEYFNLQGVRVDNPAAGQLIIRKQGKEVSKVLVK